MKKGILEVICGSMFSGKTEEFMRRLKRAEFAKQRVLTIKHQIDKRKHYSCIGTIASHDGRERVAFPIGGVNEGVYKIIELARKNVDVVGIDELHFFTSDILDVILELIDEGKRVIVCGLDLNFRGEPFSIMSQLLCHADVIDKLKAICVICGDNAHFSQRLIDGKPANYDDPVILVGAEECYQARCRNCYIIKRNEAIKIKKPSQHITI
jgi:thymidine kinase